MKLLKKLKNLFRLIRKWLNPSLHDKEAKRYFADGGDELFRYNFDLSSQSLVLDLGGYKGQWTSDIYSMYCCKILIFEPVFSYFEKIRDRFYYNPNIDVYCLALGKNKKQETIWVCDDGSSVYSTSETHKETIQFEDVQDFLNLKKIFWIDLIKINIEGGEYELLRRLIETGFIKNIKQIHVQFHDFVPNAEMQMQQICKDLEITHKRILQYKFVWENWTLRD